MFLKKQSIEKSINVLLIPSPATDKSRFLAPHSISPVFGMDEIPRFDTHNDPYVECDSLQVIQKDCYQISQILMNVPGFIVKSLNSLPSLSSLFFLRLKSYKTA